MNLEDDLKQYEVRLKALPVWYFETIRDFIANYSPDMTLLDKAMLFKLLQRVENEHEDRK